MNEVIPFLLFLGALVRAAVPGKQWCRHVPATALVAGFLLHVAFFLLVRGTRTNTAALMVGFLPLCFLWIYVPVGVVELMAGVSILVKEESMTITVRILNPDAAVVLDRVAEDVFDGPVDAR